MSEPLWSDKAIDECFESEDDFFYARMMRNEYEAALVAQAVTIEEQAAEIERLKAQLAATVAAEPILDWSQYDRDYRWFAIDADGTGLLHEEMPVVSRVADIWCRSVSCYYVDNFNLNGVDFRATLTERPNQPPSGVTKA